MNPFFDTCLSIRGNRRLTLMIGAALAAMLTTSTLRVTPRKAAATPATTTVTTAHKKVRVHHPETPFKIARIYWEYNSSAEDLGVHVTLDAENWKRLRIENPCGGTLFEVKGKGPYNNLGMTELFFEGAEPSLSEVPLQDLLDMFPEGEYEFEGRLVDGGELESCAAFTHAIPDGPVVSATVGGNSFLQIHWSAVTSPPPGFPNRPIHITGYQVIVESFEVTVPGNQFSITVPPEFVASLEPGEHDYEVLAIEEGGNQTLREGTFVK